MRHAIDIKLFYDLFSSLHEQAFKNDNITYAENLHWRKAFDFIAKTGHSDNGKLFQKGNSSQSFLRRSIKLRRPNPKYFNDYFET